MKRSRAAAPVAVLDIGSNSLKLLVGVPDGTRVRTVHFNRITTRLGEGLHERARITDAATARTARAAKTLAADARRHGAGRVQAVGTWALRFAENGRAVARRIERESGVAVRILDGEEEARLAFLSARSRLRRARAATFVLDIGGGSAQFVAGRGSAIVGSHSLPLGALQLTERHLHHDPVARVEYLRMYNAIERAARPVVARYAALAPQATFVAVGGSATTALAMARRGRGTGWGDGTLSLAQLRGLEKICVERTIAERRGIPGLPPDRADIMPAGLAVMLCFMTAAHKRVAHITGGGVREGMILVMAPAE